MSVQFRTSQSDLITKANKTISKEIGVCCRYDAIFGTKKDFTTPLDCYLENGTFFYANDLNAVNCFDISSSSGFFGSSVLGCCCACSIAADDPNYQTYVSQMVPIEPYCDSGTVPAIAKNTFGLKKITQCECERIGGKWTAGDCPTELADDASVTTYCYERMHISLPTSGNGGGGNGTPCGSDAASGQGVGPFYKRFNFSQYNAGNVTVSFDMISIPDKMDIYYPAPFDGATYSDALPVKTSGVVSGTGILQFYYDPNIPPQYPPNGSGYSGDYTEFTIKMTGTSTNTRWSYTVSCPERSSLTSLVGAGFSCDVDLRLPRSCCYFDYDINGFPIGISCENVCNPRECELKSISSNPSVFSTGTICAPNILSTTITQTPYTCTKTASLIASGSNLFQNIPYGSCYRLIDNGSAGFSYECDVTPQFFCYDGYWVELQNETDLCNNSPYSPQVPQKSFRKVEPETMTENAFLNLKIREGQFYKGGYFIGIFEPGSPITPKGSEIYGSTDFNSSKYFNSNASGNGDKYSKWAIFVEPSSFTTSLFESGEIDNTDFGLISNYDGFYNCYGNNSTFSGIKNKTMNTVVGKNRKGFVDFYLPSINELMFLTKQASKNSYLANLLNMNGIYMSSSYYKNFIYTQYMSENPIFLNESLSSDYGRVLLAKSNSLLNCVFFRKIVLT